MIQKMKERSGDNFLGKVLLMLVELDKSDESANDIIGSFLFDDYKAEADQLSQDFYLKARKIPLTGFWRQQFEKYQTKRNSQGGHDEDKASRFVAELIRKYL